MKQSRKSRWHFFFSLPSQQRFNAHCLTRERGDGRSPERDKDSSTVVLEQINTVHQPGPEPSDSSTNSNTSAGTSHSTGLQQQRSNLDKNLITNCTKKKKKREERKKKKKKLSVTEHVRFIIIESLENVQADLN